jgi:hypothetical protein
VSGGVDLVESRLERSVCQQALIALEEPVDITRLGGVLDE